MDIAQEQEEPEEQQQLSNERRNEENEGYRETEGLNDNNDENMESGVRNMTTSQEAIIVSSTAELDKQSKIQKLASLFTPEQKKGLQQFCVDKKKIRQMVDEVTCKIQDYFDTNNTQMTL
jgi:hypothetical protein